MPKAKKEKVEVITFYSPRAKEQIVICIAQQWVTQVTPAGNRTIQTPGKTAEFKNGIFKTYDEEIINYLTDVYADKRFPIVRTDIKENKSGGAKPPIPTKTPKFPGQV